MSVYPPGKPWPKHKQDRWNELLDLARSKGWTFEPYGHRFGQIKCPADSASCKFPPIGLNVRSRRRSRVTTDSSKAALSDGAIRPPKNNAPPPSHPSSN